ncbi:circadian clock KaiB family protein [Hymenobacter cheonanensis]|uniref:circadian clock KaiB family protein n=1 Tax=Hymenobacter sp. CA2-7 TaxID=3063993 RepID=UPI002713410D|nr:circadian clock KaiB family protein [Hymenobacter sp. CA2-7]MDO7884028.1 circadian clock KaiB family protein [Hymenobacter sp. CA2-7]
MVLDSAAAPGAPLYELHLYVSGATPNSTRALRNIKEICEQHLAGRYVLRIIDMYQQPQLAQQEQIIAAPTLVRQQPLPRRQLVGDLSNRPAVLAILGLDHLPPPATL